MSWCNPNWEAITSILGPSFVVFLYQRFDLEFKSLRALYQDSAQGFSQMFQIHLEIDLDIKQQSFINFLQSLFRN